MDERKVVSKINEYLHTATKELCTWLSNMLPRVTNEWWQECVISNLSFAQKMLAEERGYTQLDQFDLAALLRVADKSWYDMRSFAYLPTSQRECVRAMMKVRNNWAHIAGAIYEKDVIIKDLNVILNFFETVIVTNKYTDGINELIAAVETTDFSAVYNEDTEESSATPTAAPAPVAGEIQERDKVYLAGDPNTKGMVFAVSDVGGMKKYEVFVEGEIKTYYEGQICKIDDTPSYSWIDMNTF
jgi:isoleucyl-tRNA synthetase